jgi:hypothetical protein
MRTRILLCIGAGLGLAGCQTTGLSCPPDAAFSAESQRKLAAEMRAAVPEAEWPQYIIGYKRLRSACRALDGVK